LVALGGEDGQVGFAIAAECCGGFAERLHLVGGFGITQWQASPP
jgi:hypothetical protein